MKTISLPNMGLRRAANLVGSMALLAAGVMGAFADETKVLKGHVPPDIARLHLNATGRVPATNQLHLAIGLPLRNKDGLTNLLEQIYDRSSTNFHHYLSPEQFAQRFGPPEADYQKIKDFAKANGLEVVRTYPSRMVLDVSGTVSNIEGAFHVALRTYRHPTENREFYAPDSEPSVDASLSIQDISGLDNFCRPHKTLHQSLPGPRPAAFTGSGPGGTYMGNDLRNAYVPGCALTGAGQTVALVEFDIFYQSDITAYEQLAGLPNVVPQVITLEPFIPVSSLGGIFGSDVDEVSLDIEMVVSMAPGANVVVVEGDLFADILGTIASNPNIQQFSVSYTGMTWFPALGTGDGEYMQMAAQGQAGFDASGDSDANTISWPSDEDWATSVGGTSLTMTNGTNYGSEAAWNWNSTGNPGTGSCGGVSGQFGIPYWQFDVDTTTPGGSRTMRNVPDVALTADNMCTISDQGVLATNKGGTSFAAPLWAAFTALVNEAAANNNQAGVGFVCPALYDIARGPNYLSCFHDVTLGSNTWSGSPNQYFAGPGYDLCTGLGSPSGVNLINTMLYYDGSIWVDFSYTGTENGSLSMPYNTMSQAVTAVNPEGNIIILPGSSSETLNIEKPMNIRVYSSAVTIGQ